MPLTSTDPHANDAVSDEEPPAGDGVLRHGFDDSWEAGAGAGTAWDRRAGAWPRRQLGGRQPPARSEPRLSAPSALFLRPGALPLSRPQSGAAGEDRRQPRASDGAAEATAGNSDCLTFNSDF